MWCFHQKLKRLSSTLSAWSKTNFGNIHDKVKDYEERIKCAENELINQGTDDVRIHLHILSVEYIKFLKLEESILRQKSQLNWFQEGDANTGYFHALLRGRKKRLFILQVKDDDGEWYQGDENIAETACTHF